VKPGERPGQSETPPQVSQADCCIGLRPEQNDPGFTCGNR
jgi:hypothetical protein